MSKTATIVGRAQGVSDQITVRLSEPLNGHDYVVVSAVVACSGPETYIFAATPAGLISSWTELDGSFRGALDHAEALRRAGYELVGDAP